MRQRLGLILVCLGLACSSIACAPALVGPTASGYAFSLQAAVPRIWLGVFDASSAERFPPLTEVMVRVQDASGQPVDGVPVTFAVDPAWAQHASVAPAQAVTRGGIARTIFQAERIGVVRIMARVDNIVAQTRITVSSRPSPQLQD
ncbi:MAG TPA: Ig-like domain-containing protein [Candidatus Tectomicrobia bacterium]|jgi:hypothetical protein